MENKKELMMHIKNAAVELHKVEEKFESIGIELDMFEDAFSDLTKAMSELIPSGIKWIDGFFADYTVDQLLELEQRYDEIESISHSSGNKVTIEYKNGESKVLELVLKKEA